MSQSLYTMWIEPLTHIYFQKALIGGSLVAIVCGVVGCFVILRRMAFLGDALSHAMLAGVASGYLFMRLVFDAKAHAPAMLIGAIVAAVLTVGLIGFISRVSRLKEDTAIGIMYTGVFAAGGVLVSLFADKIHIDLVCFIMGNVLAVNDTDLWVAGGVAAAVLSLVILFYRQLQLTSFDPVMAAAIGVPVVFMDYLLTTCTSFVVVSGVTMVGLILVVGLLVTPAASAYLLCDRLSRMLVLAALFGVTSVVGGLYTALWMNVAGASAIVLWCTLQFLVVLTIAPRYGLIADWLRRRQMIPQSLIEDILGAVLRSDGVPLPLSRLRAHVHSLPERITNAVRGLERQGLIERQGPAVSLTTEGHREATRLLRAHRIWETYLERLGMPASQVHARAHRLEHLHDPHAIEYLDDKLGHPLHDPHGSVIPSDELAPGPVKASLLRAGQEGVVQEVGAALAGRPLAPGMHIRIGPRQAGETIWTVQLPDGSALRLDHGAADALLVSLDEPTSGRHAGESRNPGALPAGPQRSPG